MRNLSLALVLSVLISIASWQVANTEPDGTGGLHSLNNTANAVAEATFISETDDGIITEVFVQVFKHENRAEPPSDGLQLHDVIGVSIFQTGCVPVEDCIVASVGGVQLDRGQFKLSGSLKSAFLDVDELVLSAHETNTEIVISLEVAWAAIGELEHFHQRDHGTYDDDVTYRIHGNYKIQGAVATGLITDGLTNYTPLSGSGRLIVESTGTVNIYP